MVEERWYHNSLFVDMAVTLCSGHGQEHCHMIKEHSCSKATRMLTAALVNFDANYVALEEVVLRTPYILIQSFAALRRFVGLLGQFISVPKNQTGHTQLLACGTCVPRINYPISVSVLASAM